MKEIRKGRGRVVRWLGRCLLLGLIALPAGRAADVVEMSPYEVAAQSAEFLHWSKFRSPNFLVYTDARADEIRPYLRQMEMMYMVNQVIFGRVPLRHEPIRVILPTARSDWRKLRSKGRVQWTVAATAWSRFSYTSLVEYDWQDQGLNVMWNSLSGLLGETLGIDWAFPLRRGMGNYWETMHLAEGGIKVGQMNARVLNLRRLGFMDWERFFSLNSSSREFVRDGDNLRRLSGQSALFVHYILMSEDPAAADKLLAWSAQIAAGTEPTSDAFAAIFGMGYEELDEAMKAYVRKDQFNLYNYGIPDGVMDFVVTELAVGATEMRELFVLIQIINQNVDESEAALDGLLRKGLKSPILRPLLVEACLRWARPDAAVEILEAMIAEGDDAAETHSTFAYLKILKQVGTPLADQRISAAEYEQLRSLADAALQREPMHSLTNLTLGWLLALQEDLTDEDVAEIRGICRRMDGNGETDDPLAALALASQRMGDTATAQRLIQLLDNSPFTDVGVRRFIDSYREAYGDG